MWFWFSLAALLFWSGSDLFSKIGCQDSSDPYSHLKMVTAVGLVMGLHAAAELLMGHAAFSVGVMVTYLPVSLLYIASMTVGYLGLRHIELSISSPICNCSGAVVAVLSLAVFGMEERLSPLALAAVALVCLGVVALGITEATEDEALRVARQDAANRHYVKSWLALLLPLVYCLLDALGTFADSVILETVEEDAANVAYELTFLLAGIVSFVYVRFIKKQRYLPRAEGPKYMGALFETAGQFFYIYALSDTAHVAFSAPIISSYCAVSVLWGRIFLKERLTKKHYLSVAAVVVGVIILGILDL